MTDHTAMMDRVIRERRSIRAFRPEPIPRQVVEELLDVARWAPSASNSQPWRVTTLAGEGVERLRQRLEAAANVKAWNQTQIEAFEDRIANGLMAWILDCIEEPIPTFLVEGSMRLFGAPVALLVSCEGERGGMPAGVSAFVTTLLLAAYARGLGTVWLGWPLGHPEIIREEFALPEDERPCALVALGYPNWEARVNQRRSPRYPVESFTRWIGWE